MPFEKFREKGHDMRAPECGRGGDPEQAGGGVCRLGEHLARLFGGVQYSSGMVDENLAIGRQ